MLLHEGDLAACSKANGSPEPNPFEWRLFIDLLKRSLKAVMLHNKNILPSIPVGYAVYTKETYDNIKQLLRYTNCHQHHWQLCGDLKVVALVMNLQLGYTKYCCFLCECNIRAEDACYIKKDWPLHQLLIHGEKTFNIHRLLNSVRFCCHHYT